MDLQLVKDAMSVQQTINLFLKEPVKVYFELLGDFLFSQVFSVFVGSGLFQGTDFLINYSTPLFN